MIHPTYRSLDAPVKLLGLSWRQWIALLIGGGTLVAVVHYAGVPSRPAISLCTILIGVPLALAYLAEETGFSVGRLIWDMSRWAFETRRLSSGANGRTMRGLFVRGKPSRGDGSRPRDAS